MPRRPLDLYDSLIALVDGDGERARVRALRALLRRPRAQWPQPLADTLDAAGVGLGYLQRGLLSIHTFAPDVREALGRGLPLALARLVNGIDDEAARAEVLAPLAALPEGDGQVLLPRGVAKRIERDARALRQRHGARPGGEVAPVDARGWLRATVPAATPRPLPGSVWVFPRADGLEPELLSPRVVEVMLARLLPHGGALVDVTAGGGTIAAAAQRFGVRSWSGDLVPGAPFVHRADARTLLRATTVGIERGCADVLVVHPSTYPVWRHGAAARADGGLDAYRDDVEAMVTGSLGVVKPGGHVVVVSRPVRRPGAVWLSTSHLAQGLQDAGLRLVAYVVAVAEGGGEDWHLLVGHVRVVR